MLTVLVRLQLGRDRVGQIPVAAVVVVAERQIPTPRRLQLSIAAILAVRACESSK